MLGLSAGDLGALWERRVEVLSIRETKWIPQSVFAPLVFLLLLLVVIGFSTDLVLQATLAYGPFFVLSIILYFAVKNVKVEDESDLPSRRKAASFYGVFDVCMLTLFSATALLIGLGLVRETGLRYEFTLWLTSFALMLYIIVGLVSLAFSPRFLRQRSTTKPQYWRGNSKWLLIIPNAMIGISLVAATFMARLGESTLTPLLLSAIAFFVAFSILPIYIRGFIEVEILLLSGFNFDPLAEDDQPESASATSSL